MKRGDVVIMDFPFKQGGAKVRPALVVQNDRDNARLSAVIVALTTGNLRHIAEPTHLLIDPASTEGAASGLHHPSLVNCTHLFTVNRTAIQRTISRLSDALMRNVGGCLRVALQLP